MVVQHNGVKMIVRKKVNSAVYCQTALVSVFLLFLLLFHMAGKNTKPIISVDVCESRMSPKKGTPCQVPSCMFEDTDSRGILSSLSLFFFSLQCSNQAGRLHAGAVRPAPQHG